MRFRTPLAKARGLGSAKEGSHHWWMQRLTAIALIPLVLWAVVSVVKLHGADYKTLKTWLGNPGNASGMIVLVLAMFHHAQLGLQVVIEDYVHCEAKKVAAIIAVKLAAALLAVHSTVSILFVAIGG